MPGCRGSAGDWAKPAEGHPSLQAHHRRVSSQIAGGRAADMPFVLDDAIELVKQKWHPSKDDPSGESVIVGIKGNGLRDKKNATVWVLLHDPAKSGSLAAAVKLYMAGIKLAASPGERNKGSWKWKLWRDACKLPQSATASRKLGRPITDADDPVRIR